MFIVSPFTKRGAVTLYYRHFIISILQSGDFNITVLSHSDYRIIKFD